MAFGLPGYDVSPMNYSGKDNILFHLEDDMSVFLKLTASTDMTYNSNMTVTTNPVMSGANVADNFSRQPKTIAISGVVVTQYVGAFFTQQDVTTVEDFVATVERWRDEKRLVRVLCKDGIQLPHAVIQNFTAKKDKEISNGLNIDLTFIGIDIVQEARKTGVNGNGSPTGAKTQKSGVQKMKEAGKAATKGTTQATGCRWLYAQPESVVNSSVDIRSARADCEISSHRGYNKTGNFQAFSPAANAQAEKIRNMPRATGVNENMKVK